MYNADDSVDFKDDIRTMLLKRKTVHIDEVAPEIKKLWKWYALEMLASVSRKQWEWNSQEKRRTKLLRDCVWIGDEALACQVLEVRGKAYMQERHKVKAGEVEKKKAGRKKGNINPEECLKKKIGVFFEYRQMIAEIRQAENENGVGDKFGWNEYIRTIEKERVTSVGGGGGKSKQREAYHSLIMPKDGLTVPV